MKKIIYSTLLLSVCSLILSTSTAFAAKPSGGGSGGSVSTLGMDISWAQCNKSVPTNQAFGIVDVNGGLANTTNSCLSKQLLWAEHSSGTTTQAKTQLYLNTANPGGMGTASWPTSNVDPAATTTSNPYGTCDGSDSLSCAWQYGWNRAVEDLQSRFQPAATQAGMSGDASTYTWWLDVETQNTWKTSGTTFDYQSNVADLEGMTAYFESVGGQVGLYSTASQWNQIVGGQVSSTSNLNGLPNWRPGGASQNTAKQACSATPLTANGSVTLTQYVSKNLDYDYSCI